MNKNNLLQTYVDEDSIYLCNIFEEKNNKKMKSSRSDGNILGRYTKNLNNNLSSRIDLKKRRNNAPFNLKY